MTASVADAAPALTLPSLEELIKPAVPPAAPDAASAASAPAESDAEMLRSLDTVISTLDNDRQRGALVAQLKKLRDAKRVAENDGTPASEAGAAGADAATAGVSAPASSSALLVVASIAQNAAC